MKTWLQRLTPPLVWDVLRWCFRPETRQPAREPIRFTGDYRHWADARRDSSGYDAAVILERTRHAARQVRDGRAVAERDSFLLSEVAPPWPVIAALQRAAAEVAHPLHVVDIGGALGTSYHACRGFLHAAHGLHWSIVEQPAHVAAGQAEFADSVLSFHPDLAAATARQPADVVLLSSVLQFLPEPPAFLRSLAAQRIPWVIIDRTPVITDSADRLTVQHVPAWIYPASYPAWFFNEESLCAPFAQAYHRLARFSALDAPCLPGARTEAIGLIFRLSS